MYARSLSKRGRSAPPPGYAGTAFGTAAAESAVRYPGDSMESKRHTPEEYGGGLIRPRPDPASSRAGEASSPRLMPEPMNASGERKTDGGSGTSLAELLSGLRGRVGTEEVILLMVMLLLSADGAGVETLLLGLILLAGRGD